MNIEDKLRKIAKELSKLSKTLADAKIEELNFDGSPEEFEKLKEEFKQEFGDVVSQIKDNAGKAVTAWNLDAKQALTVSVSNLEKGLGAGDLGILKSELERMSDDLEETCDRLQAIRNIVDEASQRLKQYSGWFSL